MSRTIRGSKPFGYEFWSARPGNSHGAQGYGPYAKLNTHRRERRASKRMCKDLI